MHKYGFQAVLILLSFENSQDSELLQYVTRVSANSTVRGSRALKIKAV